jgi:hypothetical protein
MSKFIPDDTVYLVGKVRFRITMDKQFPPDPKAPDWQNELRAKRHYTLVRVKDGRRHGSMDEEEILEFIKVKKAKGEYEK